MKQIFLNDLIRDWWDTYNENLPFSGPVTHLTTMNILNIIVVIKLTFLSDFNSEYYL